MIDMKKNAFLYMLLVAIFGVVLTSVLLMLLLRPDDGALSDSILITIGLIAIVILLCTVAANGLTKKITRSLRKLDFDDPKVETYVEFLPFIRKVTSQTTALETQLSEVAKERALIDAISGSMNEGLLLLSKDGIVLSINQSAKVILNMAGNFVGRNILEGVRNVEIIKHIETARAGIGSDATIEMGPKVYHVIFSPTGEGVLALFLDITEKADAEKRRREFSANVSHELKTPLTTISGYAELMENGMVKPDDVPEAAGKIRRETSRLINLVEDIMRLSELDESMSPVEFAEFDLCDTVRNAANSLERKAKDMGVLVRTPEEAVLIHANRDMMFELFYNLIDNGIKYNRPGGHVDVSVVKKAKTVKVQVADTGVGIEDKYFDRIFERFYRVDPSRCKTIDGTGLGLSIVKHIIACHRGDIQVHSQVGAGTTFEIELPA